MDYLRFCLNDGFSLSLSLLLHVRRLVVFLGQIIWFKQYFIHTNFTSKACTYKIH